MTVLEIAFELERDAPLLLVSQRFPELTFATWCNKERDVIEITCDEEYPAAANRMQECIQALKNELAFKVVRKSLSERGAQIVTQTCFCKNFSNSLVERHNCLKVDPVFIKRGRAWYRILSFRQTDVKRMFEYLEELGTVKIISRQTQENSLVRDTFLISAASLLGNLTKRQASALLTALARGYYEIPKRVSTEEVAESLGLPRTTFEEHLRKAESKTLKAMLPLLQFSSSRRLSKVNRGPTLRREIASKVLT